MNNKRVNEIIRVLLILLNVLFLVYYVGLAIYSRFHYDDLHFLWKLKELSPWAYMREMYFSRSGRFISYLQNAYQSRFILRTGAPWLIPLFWYMIGITAVYIPLRKWVGPRKGSLLSVVLLFYNLFVLTNIDFPIFTWTCATSYLVVFPLAFYLWYLIRKSQLHWIEWVLLACLTLKLGGGNETFTPMVLALFFCYGLHLLYSYAWKISSAWKDMRVKKLLGVAGLMMLAWVVVIIAPGNYLRMADASQFVHPSGLSAWVKAYVSAIGTFAYFEAFYIPYYLVIAAVFAWGGLLLREKLNLLFDYKTALLSVVSLWAGYLLISVLPYVYLWGGFGIQRNYTGAVFMTITALCLCAFFYGYYRLGEKGSKVAKFVILCGLFGLLSVQAYNVAADLPTAKSYAKAVDSRIDYLQAMEREGQKDPVVVEAYPIPYCLDTKYVILTALGIKTNKPVLFYLSDTAETPNEYVYHFKRVYNLSFDFVLAPSSINISH